MVETDMVTVVGFIDRVVKICKRVQDKVGKQLKDFNPALENDEEIKVLRQDVIVNINLIIIRTLQPNSIFLGIPKINKNIIRYNY